MNAIVTSVPPDAVDWLVARMCTIASVRSRTKFSHVSSVRR